MYSKGNASLNYIYYIFKSNFFFNSNISLSVIEYSQLDFHNYYIYIYFHNITHTYIYVVTRF